MAIKDQYLELSEDPAVRTRALSLLGRYCSGTTSRPGDDTHVLWMGEHVALIKNDGGYYHNRGAHYVSGGVQRVLINDPRDLRVDGLMAYDTAADRVLRIVREVHNSSSDPGADSRGRTMGRLTPAILAQHIEAAQKIDAEIPQLRAEAAERKRAGADLNERIKRWEDARRGADLYVQQCEREILTLADAVADANDRNPLYSERFEILAFERRRALAKLAEIEAADPRHGSAQVQEHAS